MTHREMSCKSFVAAFDESTGTIDKIVSVFGNVDYAGDRVVQGAFAASLQRWSASDGPIPVIFSHQWNALEAHVGVVEDAKELAPGDPLLPPSLADYGGLWVRERYDMDQPFAARLHELQKQRRIKESSFAYDVIKERRAHDGANDLLELDIIEVGPTLKGMNPETVVIDAKTRAAAAAAAGQKQAVQPHETETSDSEWDGPANEARLPNDAGEDVFKQAFAWRDPDGDPDTKDAWKFIHHEVSEEGTVGAANLQACRTGIGVLNGARDGTSIPEDDYQGVYDHLAKHLSDAGEEPPALGDDDQDDDPGDSDGDTDDEGGGGSGQSSRPPDRKAFVTLDGSYEQLQQRLDSAISAWADAAFDPYDLFCAYLEATYPDVAIVYVELWSEPLGGGSYLQAGYSVAEDGTVTLSDPTPVEVTGVVSPKGLPQTLRDRKAAAVAASKTAPGPRGTADTSAAESLLVELEVGLLEA